MNQPKYKMYVEFFSIFSYGRSTTNGGYFVPTLAMGKPYVILASIMMALNSYLLLTIDLSNSGILKQVGNL